jgi:hypothetical protein
MSQFADDEVIAEMPVYLNDAQPHLLVLQFPLKPSEANMMDDIASAKYKHVQSSLELTTVMHLPNQPQSMDDHPSGHGGSVRHITHASERVTSTVPLVVGLVRDGALHLTSLPASQAPQGAPQHGRVVGSDVLQMRPVIVRKEEEYVPVPSSNPKEAQQPPQQASLPAAAGGDDSAAGADPQQVLMKRKESEKAYSNKLNSYTHHLATARAEPFVPLNVHMASSEATARHFEQMYCGGADAQPR